MVSVGMVTVKLKINRERVYYNFDGRMPPVELEAEPAPLPPADMGPKLITDTTLRDGAQDSRIPLFPNEARLRYVDLLHKLDSDTGRIHTVETFIYQKRDLWVLEKLLARGYEFPKITTWIRANPKDVKEMYEASQGRVKETGMLASSSDHHIFDKLGYHSKEEAVEKYLKPILTACEYDITPRVHLEDTTRADIHGWVIPFMQTVLDATEGRAKFRVCDTIGWGVSDPYAALPQGIPRLISTLRRDPGFDLTVLSEMAALIEKDLIPVPRTAPVVGEVFTTQAGIHQAGVAKQVNAPGGLIYLAYDPALVGRTEAERSVIGAMSGSEGIVAVLNAEAGRRGAEVRFSTTSRVVKEIYDSVQEAYDGHYDPQADRWNDYRTTFFTPEEIWQMAASSLNLDDGA